MAEIFDAIRNVIEKKKPAAFYAFVQTDDDDEMGRDKLGVVFVFDELPIQYIRQ